MNISGAFPIDFETKKACQKVIHVITMLFGWPTGLSTVGMESIQLDDKESVQEGIERFQCFSSDQQQLKSAVEW